MLKNTLPHLLNYKQSAVDKKKNFEKYDKNSVNLENTFEYFKIQDPWYYLFKGIFLYVALYPRTYCTSTIKDTHREKALSNKTLALTKSTNMVVWVADTSNQLFIRGS